MTRDISVGPITIPRLASHMPLTTPWAHPGAILKLPTTQMRVVEFGTNNS